MEDKTPITPAEKINTGYEAIGFRPVQGSIAIILTSEDRAVLNDPENLAEKPAKTNITLPKSKELFKGATIEKEEQEAKEKERT